MERDEQCMKCRYWKGWRLDHVEGDCMRHAPTIHIRVTAGPSYGSDGGVFPKTQGRDWCGDFEHATPKQIAKEGPAPFTS